MQIQEVNLWGGRFLELAEPAESKWTRPNFQPLMHTEFIAEREAML